MVDIFRYMLFSICGFRISRRWVDIFFLIDGLNVDLELRLEYGRGLLCNLLILEINSVE